MLHQPLLLHKPVGLTPYQAIQLFKQHHPAYKHSKISAAGRLDPMAEGLLLLLVDQDNKLQHQYLQLNKTYQTRLIFGLTTDTYDLLGLPKRTAAPNLQLLDETLNHHTGTIQQAYPPYSAVQVNGRPLYYWARQSLLSTIKIPQTTRTIYTINKVNNGLLSNKDIYQYITNTIPFINGNYRQQAIIEAWQKLLLLPENFITLDLLITCSSGTYIRALAHSIGQHLQSSAIAMTITRTHVGPYQLNQAIQLPYTPGHHS